MTSSLYQCGLPSAMLMDLAYWATKRNKHSLILFGGVLCGMSLSLFNMINLITIDDPLETAFKYPRTTLPPYMTPIEPQVGKFYDSPVALGAGASAVLTVTMTALGTNLQHGLTDGWQLGLSGTKSSLLLLLLLFD